MPYESLSNPFRTDEGGKGPGRSDKLPGALRQTSMYSALTNRSYRRESMMTGLYLFTPAPRQGLRHSIPRPDATAWY